MLKKLTKSLNLNKYSSKTILKYLFLFSFLFSLVITLIISYNLDFSKNYNLLFDSDSSRVINDAINPLAQHLRIYLHPLYILLLQPFIFLLSGFTIDRLLALIILSSLITALSVIGIYKILSIFNKDQNFKVLLCLCYLFSYGNYVYTSGIELYNLAALFLIYLWYYTISKYQNKKFTKYQIFIFILFGVLTFAITITNYAIFLIVLFILFLAKKLKLRQCIIIVLTSVLLIFSLSGLQKIVWQNTPFVLSKDLIYEKNFSKENNYPKRLVNVVKDSYFNSILGNKAEVKVLFGSQYAENNYKLIFTHTNFLNICLLFLFYLLTSVIVIRNFKKNLYLNIGLLLSLLFNTILHFFYGNDCCFLYSLHFLYIIFIFAGINYSNEKSPQLKKTFFYTIIALLIFELIINNYYFYQLYNTIKDILPTTYFINTLGTPLALLLETIIIIIISLLVFLFLKTIKLLKKTKDKDKKIIFLIGATFCLLLIQLTFLSIDITKNTNKILWFNLTPKTKQKITYKTSYLNKNFKTYFKDDIKDLEVYLKEYTEFLNTTKAKTINNINWLEYYFFGMANRRKLLFLEDKLLDISTGEVLYTFDVKELLLVPNKYEVLIQTKNNDFIKIYEDEEGIHYNKNNHDKIITGTSFKINLYSFTNQKYQNIKKVLYNEILFNIKDSKIYPNIIVYDKPWYRDAAITAMVLKQTNNTSLIADWVNNITEIYDKQNNGIAEPDNLGELLYLLSTQENINYDLVDKIEEEAERIATSNENGYYLFGQTDYSNQYLYQNLWYKLGIESVGRNFDFDISNLEDDYSKLAWWSTKTNTQEDMGYNELFPYLTTAYHHTLKTNKLVLNKNVYPLSWEQHASNADYSKMLFISDWYSNEEISPTHTWTASELLLYLLDETKDLKEG